MEQKNGAIVRQFVGYDRFEGVEPCRVLTALYRQLRLYINFFQPSLKLISKQRIGSRVIKKYDRAQMLYQRLLATERVSREAKAQLKAQFAALDPLQLLTQIQALPRENVGAILARAGGAPAKTPLPRGLGGSATTIGTNPDLSAKALFERVQQQHPGQFKDDGLNLKIIFTPSL